MSARTMPVAPSAGVLRPMSEQQIRLAGGFWGDRQERNASTTLRHVYKWLTREGWIDNFVAAAEGRLPEAHRGREFADSEVYKFLEGVAWELGRSPDEELETIFQEVSAKIAAAQESDGYLNTTFGHQGKACRYADFEWGHELYCYGHLIQAAVARMRCTGNENDLLVDVALRVTDHVCSTFGSGGRDAICGHPEIEMALAELYRATGERRYLDQAARFVELRGHGLLSDIEFGRSYYQDDEPLREARAFRGHAVRAMYLSCAAVDVAIETGDDDLVAAVVRQWQHSIARRTYLTGAMGSRHQDEAFGDDFELPPDRAYAETCAGIGSIYLAWRLLLATGGTEYADLIERTLYNVVAASPGLDGACFFYTNPLHQRVPGAVPDPDQVSPRARASLRAPWFSVACCPTNVTRTMASLAAYFATTDGSGIQVHQYFTGDAETTLDDGRVVGISAATSYPWEGAVRMRIEYADGTRWRLSLRIPPWASGARVHDPDGTRSAEPGTVTLEREWRPGDEVLLELPVTARPTWPDPRIDAVRGCVAVERGPLVYCAESVDQSAESLDRLVVDAGAPMRETQVADLPEDTVALQVRGRVGAVADAAWPYGPKGEAEGKEATVTLIPYHQWANRGPASMRVWLPAK